MEFLANPREWYDTVNRIGPLYLGIWSPQMQRANYTPLVLMLCLFRLCFFMLFCMLCNFLLKAGCSQLTVTIVNRTLMLVFVFL